MTQQHGLTLGSFDFVSTTPSVDGWLMEAVAEGTSFGNPEAVIETIQSLLTNGSLALLQRWENREIPLRIRISAPSAAAGPALAKAEGALMGYALAATEDKAPLIYTPPADDALPAVFDVVSARLDRDYGDQYDVEEVTQEYRYYLLTLNCLPFARDEDSTVASALPLPPTPGTVTTVNIDTCGSTTGWSRETTGTSPTGPTAVTVSGQTAVQVTAFIDEHTDNLRAVRTGAVSMGATPYLMVDIAVSSTTPPAAFRGEFRAHFDGVSYNPIALFTGAGEGGTTRLYFQPPVSFSVAKFLFDFAPATPFAAPATWWDGTVTLQVFNVARTDTVGAAATSTNRQQMRIVDIAGSAPTTAALRVYDSTPGALGGSIIVHTSRNIDWQPPMRRWLTSSSVVTADTAMVSGGRNTLTANTVYRVPVTSFTSGAYALMARLSVSTGATLSWQARIVDSAGAATVGSSVITSGSVTLPTATAYTVYALGALILPPVETDNTSHLVEITLTGTANMTLDEAWLFGLTDGALTWLKDSDSLTWVEIRSPELDSARPSVFGGLAADRTDGVCVDWKCESFGVHRFDPGQVQVTTVTTSTLASQSEIEHYRRFHSHPYDEDPPA